MKKIIILLQVFILSIIISIPSVYAFSYDDLNLNINSPIAELNGLSLNDVFKNRNMAMPDLTGKEYLGDGEYFIGTISGLNYNYNIYNGVYTVNGDSTSTNSRFIFLNVEDDIIISTSIIHISGTYEQNSPYVAFFPTRDSSAIGGTIPLNQEIVYTNGFISKMQPRFYFGVSGTTTFHNYQFKLQLEKGSIATPYQVPTNGPYNDLDISTLGISEERLDYWFNIYQILSYVSSGDRYRDITNILSDTLDTLLQPLFSSLSGWFNIDLANIMITPGFGEITWFTVSLLDLTIIVISMIVWFGFILLIWSFFKWFIKIFAGSVY